MARRVDPASEDEIQKLLPHLTGHYRPFFILLVMTGIRTSEALGLTRDDLWRENGTQGITITRLKRSDRTRDKLEVLEPLFSELVALTSRKRKDLFPFSRIAAWKALKRFCALAGIRNLNPHQFRHSYARFFNRSHQIDPATGQPYDALTQRSNLAAVLGHSSTRNVERYFQPHQDEVLGLTRAVQDSFGFLIK